jgi:putative membrane protein insertion efficiency factor
MSNFAKFVALQLLRAYKWAISPLLPPACRYLPTCSEYAMEAVERYGALRGGWIAFTRILRCHPFARSGYDPVIRRVTAGTDQSLMDQCGISENGGAGLPGLR